MIQTKHVLSVLQRHHSYENWPVHLALRKIHAVYCIPFLRRIMFWMTLCGKHQTVFLKERLSVAEDAELKNTLSTINMANDHVYSETTKLMPAQKRLLNGIHIKLGRGTYIVVRASLQVQHFSKWPVLHNDTGTPDEKHWKHFPHFLFGAAHSCFMNIQ